MPTLRHSLARLVLLAAALAPPVLAQDAALPERFTGRSAAKGGSAKSYMVVAANPLAAEAGAAIIKAGGSAADAAIAIQLVLTIVEPQSSGIGGGAFALFWDEKAKRLSSYDGREAAPAAALENRFLTEAGKPLGRMDAIVGGRSVGVPGVIRLLELLHQRHGKLSWAKDFEPAIMLAENGFAISPRLHGLLKSESALRNIEPAKSFYYQPDGQPKPVGTILRNPQFADVLRTIAAKGADAFYTGAIAADIVRVVHGASRSPGDMTIDDLKTYRAKEREPLCGTYRGYKVCGVGPPSSGGVGVLQSLGTIERFDMRALGPGSAGAEHLLIEAGRLALADRAVYLADPDKVQVPTAALISPEYLKQRSSLLSLERRMAAVEAGKVPLKGAMDFAPAPSPELPSTSHFSIVDRAGNAIALTSSVEAAFGSRLMVDGFILNNQLTDFSYEDVAEKRTVANRVGGGKRPRSSMSPTIVFDPAGKIDIVVGSPLGAAIVGIVVKTLVAMIDWQMPPDTAAAAPGALFFGNAVLMEKGLEPAKPAFVALGHQVRVGEYASGIHAIRVSRDGTLLGGADPRREGVVIGE